MTPPDPARQLASAALEAADGPERAVLERGEVPEALGDAAASFAASRSGGKRWRGRTGAPIGGMTAALEVYLTAGIRFAADNGGRWPTATELAGAVGRSTTAAGSAIARLRRLGRWAPDERDETPHTTDQTPGVEG